MDVNFAHNSKIETLNFGHSVTMMLFSLRINESADNSGTTIYNFYPPWSIPIICSLSILGLSGNVLVCLTIWKATFLHNITNYLILNLSVTDSFVCIFSLLQLLWSKVGFPNSEIAKHIFCHLLSSQICLWLSTTSSAFALVLVSLERFIGIVYPLHYQLLITATRVRIAITFQWILALIAEAYNAVLFLYDVNENACVFKFQMAFFTLQIILNYALPVTMLIYLYCRMFSSLKTAISPSAESNTFDARIEQNQRARKNVLINLFIVTILFVAFLTPSQFLYFLKYFVKTAVNDDIFVITVYILTLCNSVVNPLVYSFRYKEFQKALRLHVLRVPF